MCGKLSLIFLLYDEMRPFSAKSPTFLITAALAASDLCYALQQMRCKIILNSCAILITGHHGNNERGLCYCQPISVLICILSLLLAGTKPSSRPAPFSLTSTSFLRGTRQRSGNGSVSHHIFYYFRFLIPHSCLLLPSCLATFQQHWSCFL